MRSHSSGALAPAHHSDFPPHREFRVEIRPEKPRRRGPVLFAICALLVVVATAGWLYYRSAAGARRLPPAIRTATAKVAPLEKTLRLSGLTVAGRFSTLLSPRLRGTRRGGGGARDFSQVLEMIVPSGTYVQKGEVVAEFDRLSMLNRLADYEASIVQSRANLKSLYARLEVRRKNYEQNIIRVRGQRDMAELDLKRAPILSAIQAEKNRLLYEEYSAQYEQIVEEAKFFEISERAAIRRSELSQDIWEVELDRARRNADAMVVESPMDGLAVVQVIRRGEQMGEIRAGDELSPGRPYMQIVDPSTIHVDATVNQVDVNQLRVGAPARVYFDAFPGLELPARIASVGWFARGGGARGSYVAEVPVRLALEKLDKRVIPNYSVSAEVVVDRIDDALTVPRTSVFSDPEDGSPVAFVRAPTGWEKRDLELGLTSNLAAQVKSGLNPGDVVAAEWPPDFPATTP
jgi:multidrug efflux pump subunit AcrA (membrane-fusion protein)